MIADLYDFDGTVFNGESGSEFYIFCLKRHPKILKHLPKQGIAAAKHFLFRKITLEQFKETFYCWLNSVDTEAEAKLFWKKNAHRMNGWFKPKEHDVPVVICSASPVFQIKPICDKLGVSLVIATDMDEKTGKLRDINCKGANKLDYIKKYAPDYTFSDVYTDNTQSDAPILSLASRNKYKVVNEVYEKI